MPTPVNEIVSSGSVKVVFLPSFVKETSSQRPMLTPAAIVGFFRGSVELESPRFAVAHLRVDAQHRPQRGKALRQQGAQTVLLGARRP